MQDIINALNKLENLETDLVCALDELDSIIRLAKDEELKRIEICANNARNRLEGYIS